MRWVLAIHVMAVISWMAGQLYLWRLFVYHAMEGEPVVRARFEVMERRLLRAITTPAMVVSVATGATMLAVNNYLLHQAWMHVKLAAVLLMLGCHGISARARKRLAQDPGAYDHRYLRVMNELPTLLMIIIVIMVIVRPFM